MHGWFVQNCDFCSRWTRDFCLGIRKYVSIPKSRHMLSRLGMEKMLKLKRQDMCKTGDFSFFCLIKFRQGRLYFSPAGVVPSWPNCQLEGAPPFM